MSDILTESIAFRETLARTNNKATRKVVISQIKSLIAVVLCAGFITLSALQFQLYHWLPPLQANLICELLKVLVYLPLWIHHSRNTRQSKKKLNAPNILIFLVLNWLFYTSSKIFFNLSLKRIPPTMYYIIFSSCPFISMIWSRIMFKERITVLKSIALVGIVTGIVLSSLRHESKMNEETSSTQLLLGILFAVLSSLMGSGVFIFTKKISSLHVNFIYMTQGGTASIACLILLFSADSFVIPPCDGSGLVLLLCGLASAASGTSLFYACKYGDAGKVSAMTSGCLIVLSLLWQVLFFGDIPRLLQYIAVALAVVGTGLNGFEKYLTYPRFLNKGF